jgi:hypothetical protein
MVCRREPLCKAWSVAPTMYGVTGSEVLTVVLLKTSFFWDVTLCRWIMASNILNDCSAFAFRLALHDSEDKDTTILITSQTAHPTALYHTVSHPRRLTPSQLHHIHNLPTLNIQSCQPNTFDELQSQSQRKRPIQALPTMASQLAQRNYILQRWCALPL